MTEAFHSAVRWGKPIADLEALVAADGGVVNGKDAKNGNQALHLSSQNGHIEITKWLLTKGAEINGQNGKGQTALHMSMAYDFFDQTKVLLDAGADKTIKNGDGNAAIEGIDGDKVGIEAYDGPMQKLMSANDKATLEAAYAALEAFSGEGDKVKLAQTGMKLKKSAELKEIWDQPRFVKIMGKF